LLNNRFVRIMFVGTLLVSGLGMTSWSAKAAGKSASLTQNSNLSSVSFANEKTGWMAGSGVIMKSVDGGEHFAIQYKGSASTQLTLQVINDQTVIAWGAADGTGLGSILETTDGGSVWHVRKHPAGKLADVQFISSSVGYAVTGQAAYDQPSAMYRTIDSGMTWSRIQTPISPEAVGFYNSKDGWIVGPHSNGFFHTTDGGKTWRRWGKSLPNWTVTRANIVPTGLDQVWAQLVGDSGMSQNPYTIFHTVNGKSWMPVLGISTAGAGPAPGVPGGKVTSGPGNDSGPMAVVDSNTIRVAGLCYACGNGTTSVYGTTDGGVHWKKDTSIMAAIGFPGLHGMSFVDANHGWLLEATAGSSKLLRTIDGGTSWRQVYPIL
jgi:photosystem II stability/assembly factor-like uncharacterized protein